MRLRALALVTIPALVVASLVPAASAATPKCFGKPATKVGTNGDNEINGTRGNDVIVAKGGDDIVDGRGGKDLICGSGGSDTLGGSGGNDKLSGGGGADLLFGGTGDDLLNGGGKEPFPFDAVAYTDSGNAVDVNLNLGTGSGNGNDVITRVEDVVGSDLGDRLTGDIESNALYGLGGDDILAGGANVDFLQGDVGNDTLNGGGDFDYADFFLNFDGPSPPVTADLGLGTATGQGNDTLTDIEGLVAGHGDGDALIGDAVDNELYGLGGDDSLDGAGGNDFLVPGGDDDQVEGGDGEDIVEFLTWAIVWEEVLGGTPTPVTTDLGAGTSTGQGTDGLQTVEDVAGTHLSDDLTGDDNPNVLIGFEGNDTLDGLGGDDILVGDCDAIFEGCVAGTDTLTGGPGTDECLEGEVVTECEPADARVSPSERRRILLSRWALSSQSQPKWSWMLPPPM